MSPEAIRTPISNSTEFKKPTPTRDYNFIKSKESIPTQL